MGRQRQIQDGDSLPIASPTAHVCKFIPICKLYSLHNDLSSEKMYGEWRFQTLFQHAREPGELLGFVVVFRGGFFDEFIQPRIDDGLCMS